MQNDPAFGGVDRKAICNDAVMIENLVTDTEVRNCAIEFERLIDDQRVVARAKTDRDIAINFAAEFHRTAGDQELAAPDFTRDMEDAVRPGLDRAEVVDVADHGKGRRVDQCSAVIGEGASQGE